MGGPAESICPSDIGMKNFKILRSVQRVGRMGERSLRRPVRRRGAGLVAIVVALATIGVACAPAPAPAPVTVAGVNFWKAVLNFDPNNPAREPEAGVGCRHSWAVTLSNGQVINHSNTYYYRDYPIGQSFLGYVNDEPGYGRFQGEFANGLYLSIWYGVNGYRC